MKLLIDENGSGDLRAWADGARPRELNLTETVLELRTALDRLAAVKALADEMATWCSPHGVAVDYAQRVRAAARGEATA